MSLYWVVVIVIAGGAFGLYHDYRLRSGRYGGGRAGRGGYRR